MQDPTASLGYQTVPAGAGPNSPSIGFGVLPIPAELVTFYAFEGATVDAVIIERRDASTYLYDALITVIPGAPARVLGSFSAGTVTEAVRYVYTGGTAYGVRSASAITVDGTGMSLDIRAPAELRIGDGGPAFLMRTLSGEGVSLSQAGQVGNRNNVVYANLPGNPSVTIRKLYGATDTDLKCDFNVSGFATVAGTRMDIAVNAGGGAAKGGQFVFSAPVINAHQSIPGLVRLTGLGAAATITINLQWASTGNVQQDGNDWITLDVTEVPVQ